MPSSGAEDPVSEPEERGTGRTEHGVQSWELSDSGGEGISDYKYDAEDL